MSEPGLHMAIHFLEVLCVAVIAYAIDGLHRRVVMIERWMAGRGKLVALDSVKKENDQ